MTNEEFEFLLFDRIEKIKQINGQYDLENNSYISFSGGKDSTILHYLIDLALPNNNIPRLFLNTGIEYQDIRKYVQEMAKNDNRIIVLNSGVNVKQMLEKDGYPFKSKEHSNKLYRFNINGITPYITRYLTGLEKDGSTTKFKCPNILKYQFSEKMDFKISDRCCFKLKKDVAHKWATENKRPITLTGMRKEEGGQRANINCTAFNGTKLYKFHPLLVVSEEFENEFIKRNNIKLCKLYYPPYNFERTGCKGCPFALGLQEQLDAMEKYLPNERKQCEIIWKPVYDEYRRIGYRLKKYNQMSIFDVIEEE